MRIPFDLADTLAVAVEEGTLDAAARRLRVTPSAVSQRIRALEDQLGRVLLVRSKPVRATEAGATVVRLARQARLLERDAAAELGLESGEQVRVSMPIAVNADSLATWFLRPLARLALRHPVVFDLHRDDQDFTAGLLESGTVLAAVTSSARAVAGCRVESLGIMRYAPVATPEFVARWFPAGVTTAALGHAPVVEFDRRDDLQSQWLRTRGVDPTTAPRHYVPASADFAAGIALGLGWGLLPPLQSESLVRAGTLVALPGDTVDVTLFWQQWNVRSPLLDAVAAEVVAEARRVLSAS